MQYTYETECGKVIIEEIIHGEGRITYMGVLVRNGKKVKGTRCHEFSTSGTCTDTEEYRQARHKVVHKVTNKFQKRKLIAKSASQVVDFLSVMMRAVAC